MTSFRNVQASREAPERKTDEISALELENLKPGFDRISPLLNFDAGNLRTGRTIPQPGTEFGNRFGRTGRHDLHVTVHEVPDPAAERKQFCLPGSRHAIPNTLDAPGNDAADGLFATIHAMIHGSTLNRTPRTPTGVSTDPAERSRIALSGLVSCRMQWDFRHGLLVLGRRLARLERLHRAASGANRVGSRQAIGAIEKLRFSLLEQLSSLTQLFGRQPFGV